MQTQILDRAVLNHRGLLEVYLALGVATRATFGHIDIFLAELMLPASLRLRVLLLGFSVDLLELIEDLSLDVQKVHAYVVCTRGASACQQQRRGVEGLL